MDRVERKYFPDDKLEQEVHYRRTREHGAWRRWHANGVLADELWFEDGIYVNGVMRTWYPSGGLESESPHYVNGHLVGRQSVYREDGSLLASF